MKISKTLIIFFIFACFFSWVIFILLALNHHNIIFLFPDDARHARVADAWHAVGGLGPGIAALICFKIFYDKSYFKGLLRSYSVKKLNTTGWLVSLSPFLYLAVAIIINRIVNNEWFSIAQFFKNNDLLKPINLLAWLLPSITYGFGEELGWRGFALPLLQKKYSAFIASTILSLLWIAWHIPSFWYRYDLTFGMLIGLAIGIWAGALWLTFIFNYTRGSMLAVSIWHLTWDVVSILGKDGMIAAIMSTIIMLLAVFVVGRYKGRNLSPHKKITMDDMYVNINSKHVDINHLSDKKPAH